MRRRTLALLVIVYMVFFWLTGSVSARDKMYWTGLSTPVGIASGAHGYTLIELVAFSATHVNGNVVVHWETASENENAGFHLWRSEQENGPYTRITDQLIPADSTFHGPILTESVIVCGAHVFPSSMNPLAVARSRGAYILVLFVPFLSVMVFLRRKHEVTNRRY